MNKKVIIVGKAASGKDYLREYFESCGLSICVADTTRPKRKGEVDGEEYNFIRKEEFLRRKFSGEYLETGYYGTWYYGTPVSEWEDKKVFIMTPHAVSTLGEDMRKNSFVVYLDISEKVLRERLEKRGDADSVDRRIKADTKDFLDFTDFDLRVTEPEFCAESLLRYIVRPNTRRIMAIKALQIIHKIKILLDV